MSEPLSSAKLEGMRERAEKMQRHPVAKHFSSPADVMRLIDAYEQLLEVNGRLIGGIPQRTWEGRITVDLTNGTVTGQAIEMANEEASEESEALDGTES